MKNAIIFDFDGVIIDSEPIRYETYRELFLKEYSIELPDKDMTFVGRTSGENIASFLKKYNLKGDVNELMDKRNVLLNKAFSKKENIKPLPGVFDLLKHLNSHKIKLAIASNSTKEYVTNILNYLGIDNIFDVILTGDMVNKGKPNPEIFIKVAKMLNEKRKDCMVIEDTLNGILAAKAAGMKVIAITSFFSERELISADKIIDEFSQIRLQDIQNL